VALYGGPPWQSPSTAAVQGGHALDGDVRLLFHRSEPRSALALLPDIIERATIFRPEAVGEWLLWLVLGGVLVGIPGLLALALRRAASAD